VQLIVHLANNWLLHHHALQCFGSLKDTQEKALATLIITISPFFHLHMPYAQEMPMDNRNLEDLTMR
jgi:hypothetical protein